MSAGAASGNCGREARGQAPQVLGHGSHRAQPPAEALAENPRCSQKSNQQEHARRVERRYAARHQQHLEVHQSGDGQPAFDAWRANGVRGPAAGFVITDEQVELDADPDIERQEGQLKRAAQRLRAVLAGALQQFLAGLDWRCGNSGHWHPYLRGVPSSRTSHSPSAT